MRVEEAPPENRLECGHTVILDLGPELRTFYLLKEESRQILEKGHIKKMLAIFLSAWKPKAVYE